MRWLRAGLVIFAAAELYVVVYPIVAIVMAYQGFPPTIFFNVVFGICLIVPLFLGPGFLLTLYRECWRQAA